MFRSIFDQIKNIIILKLPTAILSSYWIFLKQVAKQVSVASIITFSYRETKLHDEFTFNSIWTAVSDTVCLRSSEDERRAIKEK